MLSLFIIVEIEKKNTKLKYFSVVYENQILENELTEDKERITKLRVNEKKKTNKHKTPYTDRYQDITWNLYKSNTI